MTTNTLMIIAASAFGLVLLTGCEPNEPQAAPKLNMIQIEPAVDSQDLGWRHVLPWWIARCDHCHVRVWQANTTIILAGCGFRRTDGSARACVRPLGKLYRR